MVLAGKASKRGCLFLIIFAMQFFQLYVVFFLKRALNRVRFLFAYKSNKPHHKKYFHFF